MSDPLHSSGRVALEAAFGFLSAGPFAEGEIALTFRTRDAESDDRSIFGTALALHALGASTHPAAARFRRHGLERLQEAREPGGVWRFWPPAHPRHAFLPPDLEDSAAAASALVAAGIDAGVDLDRFDALRDGRGRFRTWLFDPGSEFSSADHPFWRETEARPDDVDAGANAQAVAFLAGAGEGARARDAVRWLVEVVEAGDEERADKWYRSAALVRYLVARAAARTDELRPALAPIAGAIRRERARLAASDSVPEIAASLTAALGCGVAARELESLAGRLVDLQRSDGSFPRAAVWYGGPKRSVDWGSSELSTVFAIEALAAFGRAVSGAPRS